MGVRQRLAALQYLAARALLVKVILAAQVQRVTQVAAAAAQTRQAATLLAQLRATVALVYQVPSLALLSLALEAAAAVLKLALMVQAAQVAAAAQDRLEEQTRAAAAGVPLLTHQAQLAAPAWSSSE